MELTPLSEDLDMDLTDASDLATQEFHNDTSELFSTLEEERGKPFSDRTMTLVSSMSLICVFFVDPGKSANTQIPNALIYVNFYNKVQTIIINNNFLMKF